MDILLVGLLIAAIIYASFRQGKRVGSRLGFRGAAEAATAAAVTSRMKTACSWAVPRGGLGSGFSLAFVGQVPHNPDCVSVYRGSCLTAGKCGLGIAPLGGRR